MEVIIPSVPKGTIGTYRIVFDDSWFYIGSSINLPARFVKWQTGFRIRKHLKNKNIQNIIDSVRVVRFEVIKVYKKNTRLRDSETALISKFWDDPFLLNRCPDARSVKNIRPYIGQVFKPKPPKAGVEKYYKKTAKFNLEGELIEVYPSISAAARSIGSEGRDIKKLFSGERKTLKGFIFKRVDPLGKFIDNEVKPKAAVKPWKKFYQLDKDGNRVAEYDNLAAATRAMGGNPRNIQRALNKHPHYKTVKGYSFVFA